MRKRVGDEQADGIDNVKYLHWKPSLRPTALTAGQGRCAQSVVSLLANPEIEHACAKRLGASENSLLSNHRQVALDPLSQESYISFAHNGCS